MKEGIIMLFKPKFCCGCGEKIERLEWKLWTSRRFCELCATEYGFYEWVPRIVLAGGLFFGLWGASVFWQKAEKSLNVAALQVSGNAPLANTNLANQINSAPLSANQTNSETAKANDANSAQAARNNLNNAQSALIKQNPPSTKQIAFETETILSATYFCGAQTKKGTPCSRRVKGNTRCFQHVGQKAMLPPEKLRIN
jgi:hypothetical protein